MGAPAVAQATSLGVTFPTDGAVFNGAPHDVYGTAGNNVLYDGDVTVIIEGIDRDGNDSHPNGYATYRKRLTLAGSIAAGIAGDYWAFSDEEVLEAFDDFYIAYLKRGQIPTGDGQYRVKTQQYVFNDTGPDYYNYGPLVNYTIDSAAPDTTITSGPPPVVGPGGPIDFEFDGTDPDPPNGFGSGIDYFDCRLDSSDDNDWDHCTAPGGSAPYTHSIPRTEGLHKLEVRAVDKASNHDPSPAEWTWGVDLTPPDITINKPLNKDRYLLHDGPTPDFSCSDPLKGDPPAQPFASGVESCTATPINDEDLGPHKFTVTATDKAGNTATKTVAYTIDPPAYHDLVHDAIAYYRLNEALGSSEMRDSSGNGHHGTYQNGVALQRDGATNCERRPHPPRVCELANPPENKAGFFGPRDKHGYVNGITAPTGAYTMEAWIKPRTGADMMVMGHGGGGQLFIQNRRLAFRQTQDTVTSPGPVIPIGEWSHVAATWDGHNTRLYVNGVQVAHVTHANKPPSGTATFYLGYGEMAPWFHGDIDEAAYYGRALSVHDLNDRWKVGTARDQRSVEPGDSPLNTEGPFTDPAAPKNGGLYAPGKVPDADFECTDPDDGHPLKDPGFSDIESCTATIDGHPHVNGTPVLDSPGVHEFTVTAIDKGGNTYVHTHTYEVLTFAQLFRKDSPIAYYRLNDGAGATTMADSSGNHHNGEYKNDQDSGPVGVSGDGDRAREFFGQGGYGYVNGIAAPRFGSTMEAWVKPLGELHPASSEFSGSSLPSGWFENIWNPGGGAVVSGGQLTVDGASAGSNATFGSGRTLDFRATFSGSAPFSHAGFAVDYNNPPWAMFSVKSDGHLYARTDNGAGDALETHLGTGLLGSAHNFRIEWTDDRLLYYVDGEVVAEHEIPFGPTQLRPLVSDFHTGGGVLRVDWLRLSPHAHRDASVMGHGDAGEIYIRDGFFRFRHMDKTVISSIPVKPGRWQQVVGTWDGVDIRIYVDGKLAGATEATTRPSSVSTFYVGYGELAPWFRGSIDEVAYYGKALPPARVFQHFLADPPPGVPAGLAGPDVPTGLDLPGDPQNPSEPTEPTKPTEPSKPTEPTTPTDPTTPTKPTEPEPPKADPQMTASLAGPVKIGKRFVTTRFACGSEMPCAGKATAVLKLSGARFSLGSKRFSAGAGQRGKLRFKMKKAQRRAMRAASKRSAKITLKLAG